MAVVMAELTVAMVPTAVREVVAVEMRPVVQPEALETLHRHLQAKETMAAPLITFTPVVVAVVRGLLDKQPLEFLPAEMAEPEAHHQLQAHLLLALAVVAET
jgi:hypothetical protein